jgi:SAM-dependent methyltransferase/predicted metal-dependent enzyme (double-stranded beta helix superfamily)
MAAMNKHRLPFAIQDLIRMLEEAKDLTPRKARELLLSANLQAEDLEPWSELEHPVRDSYGRKLIFDGGYFEMMAMSWTPGDFSAIHDHGYTEWGAVQVFGPAEHAVFLEQDGDITTLSRAEVKPGEVMSVGHQLVHQLGNPSNTNFMSFHMYGCYGRPKGGVTADARIFDLEEGSVQRTDGGVFFAMPENQIKRREAGPHPDYLTWLRNVIELKNRIDRVKRHTELPADLAQRDAGVIQKLCDTSNWQRFANDLFPHVDSKSGHMKDMGYWRLLRNELIAAAKVQKSLLFPDDQGDPFYTYAELYDDVIGQPCLDEFIASYLKFVFEKYKIERGKVKFLSIGCGTGIVEEYLIKQLGLPGDRLLGIDKSEAMVQVASRRITAKAEDILALGDQLWDVTYCGLNVFQYLAPEQLDEALAVTAQITQPGGYFFGDFITPDHIRTYPHVIRSKTGNIISLRNPVLIEEGNYTFQQSEILNVSRNNDRLLITNEGKHLRFLPPMWRLRQEFEKAFKGKVDIYDAVTLKPIGAKADTCPSTRYLLVAQKSPA